MQDTSEMTRPQHAMKARCCHECSREALGRCPDCHNGLCQEHFPKPQHSPCAERQMKMANIQVCYVCGSPVYPDQWTVSKTAHCIDQFTCKGCNRYICDELHTQHKVEDVVIARNGLRGHRYQYVTRYCDLCSPLHQVAGIRGLVWLFVVVGTVVTTVFFYFHH